MTVVVARGNRDSNGEHVRDHQEQEVVVEVHALGLAARLAHFVELLLIFRSDVVLVLVHGNVDLDFAGCDFRLLSKGRGYTRLRFG